MKKILFFLMFVCGVFNASAQTITWTGATDTNWDTVTNWSPASIPTASNDVIIPTGKTVVVNVAGVTKSIVVQGNSTVTIVGGLSFLNASSFASNTVINWSNGAINGGGTLTNAGILNLTTGNSKVISQATTITNTGTINVKDGGLLYINDGTINNPASGVIDMMSDGGNITWSGGGSHMINNIGTLRRSTTSGAVTIEGELHNSGTVAVQQGALTFTDPSIVFTGGTYNITAGATLNLRSIITCSGIMAGALNGELNWNATLNVATAATFNFTGSGFNWAGGNLGGGGTVTNNSSLNLISGNSKVINGAVVFNNAATVNLKDGGYLYLNDATINNLSAGTINMMSDGAEITWSGSPNHLLNNAGTISRNTTSGSTQIEASLKNTGTVSVTSGTLIFNDANTELTGGTYNVAVATTLQWQNIVTCSGTLSGDVSGNLNLASTVIIPAAAVFNFTGTPGINWSNGNISGPGSLDIGSKFNLTSGTNKAINSGLTLNNSNTINILDGGYFYINDAIVNNLAGGTIDLKSDGGEITWSGGGNHLLNNAGTIIRSTTTGATQIEASLKNTGTILVNSGALILNDANIVLTGGIYNVAAAATLQWQNTITCAGTLTGTINGTLNLIGVVVIPVAAVFSFTGTAGITWSNGNISGPGSLTNNTTLNLTSGTNKALNTAITLNNSNTINIFDGGYFYLNDAVVNNLASGVINMKSDGGEITWAGAGSHILNNAGTIQRTTTSGSTQIEASLKNTGTVSVNSGSLVLNDANIVLTGGTYNVATGSTLQCVNTVTYAGTLGGILNGPLYLSGVTSVPVAATFNFTGTDGIKLDSGTINGGGALTNNSMIDLISGNNKLVNGLTTINNNATINVKDGGSWYVNDGILNNLASGIIDMRSDSGNITWSGGGSHTINNFGLLKKSTTNGTALMELTAVNSGTIDAQTGNLVFYSGVTFTNNVSGIVKGTATITPPPAANFTNNGTFSPGGTPGTLTFAGDFKSSPTSVLAVDLNGLTAGTGYDVLNIQGNAIFDGSVAISLGFNPNINDQFTIATTTGTITAFGMTPTATAVYNGFTYIFSVTTINDNRLVLTMTQKTLATESFAYDNKIMLAPNPATGSITLRNDSSINLTDAVITDGNGRIISQFNLQNTTDNEIRLDHFASGQYFIKINTADGATVKRFTVK